MNAEGETRRRAEVTVKAVRDGATRTAAEHERAGGPASGFDSTRVGLAHRHIGHEAEAAVDTGSDSLGPDSDRDLTRISSGSCWCFKFTSLLRVGTLGMTDAAGCCDSCHHALSHLTKWSSAPMHYYVTQSREGYMEPPSPSQSGHWTSGQGSNVTAR